jgi:hypothetical protein
MALTLVGVTPGAFNIDSDCNCAVKSSSAAMTTSNVSVRLGEKREKVELMFALETKGGEVSDKHALALDSRLQISCQSEKI